MNTKILCSRVGCEVLLTGSCAEGHDPPISCPFYGQAPAVELDEEREATDDVDGEINVEEQRIALPAGELLAPLEVDEVLRRRAVTFVTVVGERDSGKTTLICSIYERFLKGPFAGYLFAGSRTLVDFERRSHYARVESGLARPDTPRTSISEGLLFFHLSLVDESNRAISSDLMLSDRAGETYGQVRDRPETAAGLIEVIRADRLVLLLDGARIANPFERPGALQAVRQMLRALLDGSALSKFARVQVVTTKIDLLASHSERKEIEVVLGKFRERLRADFASQLLELSFWEVAARDPDGRFAVGYGVDALFQDWAASRKPQYAPSKSDITELIKSEFDMLLLRTPGSDS